MHAKGGLVAFSRLFGASLLLCVATLCVAGAPPVHAEIDRALLIGLNYEQAPNDIPRLKFAVADARDLAELARRVMGTQTVVLLSDEPGTNLPTADEVKAEIRSFIASARPGEAILIFFSGHGTEEGGKSFIVAGDGQLVALSDIRSWLAGCAAEHKVLMVDACHSGGKTLFKLGLGEDFFRDALLNMVGTVRNMVTISACDVREVAREENGHGIFTRFLLEGLRDGAAAIDNEREVRLMALFSHVAKTVGEWGDHTQHPRVFTSGGCPDITLVRYSSPLPGGPIERKVPFDVFPVYLDKGSSSNHFYPSGWMGDQGDIGLDDNWKEGPHSGSTCIRITYSAKRSQSKGWAGIYWQDPDKDPGDKVGGFDLTGARRVTLVARGTTGQEVVQFKFGGIAGAVNRDSIQPAISTGAVTLSTSWKRYTIDLTGHEVGHVIGGFCWVAEAALNPNGCTIYLDDIQIEGEFKQRDISTQEMDLALATWEVPQPEPTARGHVVLSRKAEAFRGRLTLTGLTPNSSYFLTLNGKVRSPGNEELKRPPGKVTPAGEGFVDIDQVVADEKGNVTYDLDFPLPPGAYDVKFFVKRMGTWKVVLHNDYVRFDIPSGKILSPGSNQRVSRTFTVEGTLAGIPPGRHVWLTVRAGNLLWPKETEISSSEAEWTREVIEGGNPPDGKLSLILLMVDSAGNQEIKDWFERGRRGEGYPGLVGISGSVQLDAVRNLTLQTLHRGVALPRRSVTEPRLEQSVLGLQSPVLLPEPGQFTHRLSPGDGPLQKQEPLLTS